MRALKLYVSLMVVVMLVGFMVGCGGSDAPEPKTDPKAAKTDPAVVDPAIAIDPKVEKVDPMIIARQTIFKARVQHEEITGKPVTEFVYDLGEDEGSVVGGVNVSIIIVEIIALIALVIAIIALVRTSVIRRVLVKAGMIEEKKKDEEEQPEENEQGFSLVSLLFGIVSIGLIIALLAPVAFAAKDKTARDWATAAIEIGRINTGTIDGLKTKVATATETAEAAKTAAGEAKGAVDQAVKDAEAKISQMLVDAQAKIDQMVADASVGDAAKIQKLEAELKSIKLRYILQGGKEEKAVLRYIVTAGGVDLETQPELKKLIDEYKGTRAQRTKFAELLAAAMPDDSSITRGLRTDVDALKISDATQRVEITSIFSAIEHKSVKISGQAIRVRVPKYKLASEEFVTGAIAQSHRLLAEDIAKLEALVNGMEATDTSALGAKVDKLAEAVIADAMGKPKKAMNKMAEEFGEDWVLEQIALIK